MNIEEKNTQDLHSVVLDAFNRALQNVWTSEKDDEVSLLYVDDINDARTFSQYHLDAFDLTAISLNIEENLVFTLEDILTTENKASEEMLKNLTFGHFMNHLLVNIRTSQALP